MRKCFNNAEALLHTIEIISTWLNVSHYNVMVGNNK